LRAVAFPKLTDAQLAMLGRRGGATLARHAEGALSVMFVHEYPKER
jgi:hypothetical protein